MPHTGDFEFKVVFAGSLTRVVWFVELSADPVVLFLLRIDKKQEAQEAPGCSRRPQEAPECPRKPRARQHAATIYPREPNGFNKNLGILPSALSIQGVFLPPRIPPLFI